MCGILGLIHANTTVFVYQSLVDGLTILQHRGQDSAGIATIHHNRYNVHKDKGVVSDVFNEDNIINLKGNMGIGHVRYSTLETSNICEAQPLYTNYPYGISLVHNGNLTNTDELMQYMIKKNRHINSRSDSELLLNLFADELSIHGDIDVSTKIFHAVKKIMQYCKGGFSAIFMINNIGLVAFRDPFGIRPLCLGKNISGDYIISSESIAIDAVESVFKFDRDVLPGECFFINMKSNAVSQVVAEHTLLKPCLFEYIYFARPDSIIDGVYVHEARKNMGEKLANSIIRKFQTINKDIDIDVVIPVPETSRISALEIANRLDIPYEEGFIKNRYIARTFILPGQEIRKKSLKLKLNTIPSVFKGRNVLIVDDSIVRGNTSIQLVELAKHAGANKIYFCSAAPPVRYPNVYGINIPTTQELVAYNRSNNEIAELLGADMLFYNSLEDVIDCCINNSSHGSPKEFETSCFNGEYITGNISSSYFHL